MVDEPPVEVARYRRPPVGWRVAIGGIAVVVTALALNQLLNLGLFIGVQFIDNQYLYILAGLLQSVVFVVFPASKSSPRDRVPWYDILLSALTLCVAGMFVWYSREIVDEGWAGSAPTFAAVASLVYWAIVMEAARRAGGLSLFIVILFASFYPTFADKMPDPFSGLSVGLLDAASAHIMGGESLLGIPTRVFANLVIGFIIFGVALQHTGAGKFFIDFAFAMLGHVRGGPAKVAIFASGLMGSISGSVVSNILTIGSMTIPAMRRTGFPATYAAGVETCASTGAVLMPPIMGATAFVMASFLSVPYVEVAAAAALPSVLYYFGLFMQIDAYAARHGLRGLSRDQLPRIVETIKEGWPYVTAFAFLIWALAILQQEALAPFYATALVIVINQFIPKTRWNLRALGAFIEDTGRLFAELIGILGGIGLIIGALSMTGMIGTLTNDLVFMAGGNVFVLLLMGAATSFILGMGMTVTAAYIFLAIVLAPGLVQMGLDRMAVHMFLLYWGMLSFITPPVAIGAFAAAGLAGTSPMKTGFEAMRLGAIIYFIPFFFVVNPALILHGAWYEVILVFSVTALGTAAVAAAIQGYLIGVGSIARGAEGWLVRCLLVAGGVMFTLPGGGLLGLQRGLMTALAVAVVTPAALLTWRRNRHADG